QARRLPSAGAHAADGSAVALARRRSVGHGNGTGSLGHGTPAEGRATALQARPLTARLVPDGRREASGSVRVGLVEFGGVGRCSPGGVQVVDGVLGFAGNGDEGSGIGSEDAEPVGEVGGVVLAGSGADAGGGAPHGGAELGNELLGGVGVGAEPPGELASDSAAVAGPVDVLVGGGRVVVRGVVELGEVRKADGVGGGLVAGD